MKNLYLVFLFSFPCFFIHAQHEDIVIGKREHISSKILNEDREIWIHVPGNNEGAIFSKQDYPVVYLLDGDAHFSSVVGLIQQLSAMNGNTLCPKMIVVGIPNTQRTRDLTPTRATDSHPYVDSAMAAQSGGGENFMSFMEKELIPYIESNYPTAPYRMLIGHSFGGLTVMNTLVQRPHLFNSYVSIDPSMWWDDRSLLHKIQKTTFDDRYDGRTLFLGIANTMGADMDTVTVQNDTTFQTDHIRSIFDLDRFFNNYKDKKLSYQGKYYPEDDHGSVPLITEYDAIRFIFDFYKLNVTMEDFFDEKSDILNKVISHYDRLSNEFGIEIKPDETQINSMGYQFMRMEQYDRSEQFFKLNVENYPESFNVYDSLADLYVATGEKEKAIKYYKKSIAINKDSYSKAKLEELEK